MKALIEEYAKLNGLVFGICDAHDLTGLDESITDIPFFNGSFYERISPETFLNGAKSIIVLGVKTDDTPIFEGLNQVMAASLCGVDYHKRLKHIADGLIGKMLKSAHFNYKTQIDAGPLIEREFAIKAGLGFRGRNGCIINPMFGSFFNIALIITDLELKPTPTSDKSTCDACNKCIDACPAGALRETGYDYKKCISYLTQKKGDLTEEESRLLGVSIYGCDICQSVCLYNSYRGVKTENHEDVLRKILSMSNKDFSENFRNSNLYWRGFGTIKRNCLISINNI